MHIFTWVEHIGPAQLTLYWGWFSLFAVYQLCHSFSVAFPPECKFSGLTNYKISTTAAVHERYYSL